MKSIPSILRNKYFLATGLFLVWMTFFDSDDFLMQRQRRQKLHRLEESKAYFISQIKADRAFSEGLKGDSGAIEKFAREKYLMKRDDEELFLIQPAGGDPAQ